MLGGIGSEKILNVIKQKLGKELVINYREWAGYKTVAGGWGKRQVKLYPSKKKGEGRKMFKAYWKGGGGHNKFCGSFNFGHFCHAEGRQTFLPCLKGGGGGGGANIFGHTIFPSCSLLTLINDLP